jgi:hypothetical protein
MVLAGMTCGLPSLCLAQVYGPAGQVVTLPPEAGGFGGAYASPSFGDSAGYGTSGYGEAMPAGGYAGSACPPQGCPPADCPPQPTSCWPWKIRPLFISPEMLKPPRGTYVRLEYLLWEIEKPGDVFLGAPRIEDTTTPLVEFAQRRDNTTSNGFPLLGGGFGYTPNIDELQLRDNDGLRLTFGVPLKNYGTFEGDVWLLEQASDHYEWGPRDFGTNDDFGGLFGIEFDPVTSLKVNGVTGSELAVTGLFRVYNSFEFYY